MELRFRLFVQQHRDGRYTAHVLRLPQIAAYAKTRAAAVAQVRQLLYRHVKKLAPGTLGELVFHETQGLRRVDVEVTPEADNEKQPVAIAVNVLVTTLAGSRGPRYLLTAPRIGAFHATVTDPAQIEERSRRGLAHVMRDWTPLEIAETDLEGPEELETIAIELPDPPAEATGRGDDDTDADDRDPTVLDICGVNLTALAEQGRLGRADRRETLVDLVIATLAREGPSSVMLVGRSDVGKTALVHEVVERIRSGNVPPTLADRQVWFVSANSLIAGMQYTGQWQGRTKELMDEVRRGRQILYMGEPNEILDAGRWSRSDNNMGRFFRPAIESGQITMICETTPEGFAAGQSTEPSFMNAFRRIDVTEPDESDVGAIVQAVARRLEATYRVSIDPSAIAAVLDLARRFMPYRAFPGKAVRFLETLVGDAMVGQNHQSAPRTLTRADAIASFTRMTGLPAALLSDDVRLSEHDVRAYFDDRLLGQPDAVDAMVDLIMVLKAGLNDPRKPLGSFFFVGPTGVGKTETAKVLAEFLFGNRDRMVRVDMSEYAGSDALARFLGTAWDARNTSEIIRRVRDQPFSVVLLDEIEKAHPDVFDALLGVLGEGRLADARGNTTDFRNAIVVMTSNLGASRREMEPIGFRSTGSVSEETAELRAYFVEEAQRFFRPEFFNRIDRIVAFRPLSLEAMRLIARRELGRLLMREGIVRRNLLVEIDDAVIEQLVAAGFHPRYGARPLQREIERLVVLPLARLMVNQGPDHRHLLHFGVRDGQIHLRLVPLDVADDSPDVARPSRAEQRLEADLGVLRRSLRQLREELAAEAALPAVEALREEMSALIARTHEPTFWDEPQTARRVLSRVYHLDRVLKRLDHLAERAEFLEETAEQIRRNRNRGSIPNLARNVDELADQIAFLRMEIAGAGAGHGHDQAILRVAPVGAEAASWAGEVFHLYTAWARRKGYEYQHLETWPADDGRGEAEGPAPLLAPASLYVKGASVYEFLRGEAGLHKLNASSGGEQRQRLLARVSVLKVPENGGVDDPSRLLARLRELVVRQGESVDENDENLGIVRVYHRGRYQFVRDPRTGVRIGNLGAVLDGEIDAFLLASLQRRASERVAVSAVSSSEVEVR